MNCPNCGREITGDEKFCVGCGSPVYKNEMPAAAQEFTFRPEGQIVRKTHKARKAIAIIAAVVIGLGAVGAGAYAFFRVPVKRVFMSDESYIKSMVSKSTNQFMEKGIDLTEINKAYKLEESSVITYKPGQFVESQLASTPDMLELIKNLSIQTKSQLDTENEIMNMDIILKNKTDEMISAQMGIKGDKIGITAKGIIKDGLMINPLPSNAMSSYNYFKQQKDMAEMQQKILDALRPVVEKYRDIILEEALSSDNTTFTGNDDELGISCYRYDIDLDADLTNQILDKIVKEADGDDVVIDAICDLYDALKGSDLYGSLLSQQQGMPQSSEDLRKQLEQELTGIYDQYKKEAPVEYKEKVTVTLWFNRSEEIIGLGADVENLFNFKLFNAENGSEHKLGLDVTAQGKQIVSLKCDYTDKNDNIKGSADLSINADKDTLNLKADFDLTKYTVEGMSLYYGEINAEGSAIIDGNASESGSAKLGIKLEKLDNGISSEITIKVTAQGAEIDLGTLKIETTYKKLDSITSVLDGKEIKNSDQITEADINMDALNALQQQFGGLLDSGLLSDDTNFDY